MLLKTGTGLSMAKKEIEPLIIEVLDEKKESLSIKELTNEIRAKRGKVADSSVNENLLKLLNNGKIRISGIDLKKQYELTQNSKGTTRKDSLGQTFYFKETLKFELVKKEFIDILNLLNNFLKEHDKNSEDKLEFIFQKKIESLKKEWENYENKLIFEDLSEEVIAWLRAEDSLRVYLFDSQECLTPSEHLNYLQGYYNYFLKKDESAGYEFKQIRRFKDETIPKMPLTDNKDVREFQLMHLVYNQDMDINTAREKELEHYGLKGNKPEEIDAYLWDHIEPLTDEKFLERRLSYPKPKKTSKEIKSLFSDLIRYLVLSRKLPEKRIEEIAWALSDEKGSGKLLNQIINEATNGKKSI